MSMKAYEHLLLPYPEYRAYKQILLYVPPVFLVCGIVGNVVSFVIWTRRSMRKFSTYFYLAVLAVADSFVLLVGLLRIWIGAMTDHDILDAHDITCKLFTWLGYTSSDFSVWLIIAVTCERYLVVCHPFKISRLYSAVRSVKVVILMFVVLGAINLHFFWTVRIVYIHKADDQYIPQCAAAPAHRVLIDDVWPWVDTCIYSFVPFTLIIILNSIIISQVIKAKNYRDGMRAAGSASQQKRPLKDSGKLTIMLLTISFAFLLTTLPMNISLISTALINSNNLGSMIRFRLCRTISEMLMYANHSINFFLYCATGKKFREQLRSLAQLRLRSSGSDQAHLVVSPHTNTNPALLKHKLQPIVAALPRTINHPAPEGVIAAQTENVKYKFKIIDR